MGKKAKDRKSKCLKGKQVGPFKIRQEVHNECYLHDEVLFRDGGTLLVVSVSGQLLYKQTEHTVAVTSHPL